jgi:hypothetical protein
MRLLKKFNIISANIYNWICIKLITIMFMLLFIILLGISNQKIIINDLKDVLSYSGKFIESISQDEELAE